MMDFNINIGEYLDFLQKTFLYIPQDKESLIASPYSVVYAASLVVLLLKQKFRFMFIYLIATLIFTFGLYYGMINPIKDNEVLSIVIFAVCILATIVLFIYHFLVKHH